MKRKPVEKHIYGNHQEGHQPRQGLSLQERTCFCRGVREAFESHLSASRRGKAALELGSQSPANPFVES